MKKIINALITICIITSLCACADKAEKALPETPESTQTKETTTIEEIIKKTEKAEISETERAESEVKDDSNISDITDSESVAVSDGDNTVSILRLSTEELAEMAMNGDFGNGDERRQALGERYDEVQELIDSWYQPQENYTQEYFADDNYYSESDYYYPTGDVLTADAGINYYGGVLETYYNLDMSEVVGYMHQLGYSGDYWVRSDGVKMFGDYVMVASDYSYEPRGTITETSLGLGIVCDTGLGGWAWHDIAVAW